MPSRRRTGLRLLWFWKCQWKQVKGRCCWHLCCKNKGHWSTRNSLRYLKEWKVFLVKWQVLKNHFKIEICQLFVAECLIVIELSKPQKRCVLIDTYSLHKSSLLFCRLTKNFEFLFRRKARVTVDKQNGSLWQGKKRNV